ncbi:MAG: class I SAM-dependent methyltransferase [Actinomycetota bacterium]|nr:class I SAM-dependent methyltransferase [Actinomycetota bacterium]
MTNNARLVWLLREAQNRGLVGPGPVEPHCDNGRGFAEAIGIPDPGSDPFVDLGSGAGLPGLVLALTWPATTWILVDGNHRSADFLEEATVDLGLSERTTVIRSRAEELGRHPEFRGHAGTVVARSFGPPATTAECAAGFLAVGGKLIVSEPPVEGGERWPGAGLSLLGQRLLRRVATASGHHFAVIEQVEPPPERYPRRTGVPQRRPLF